MAPYQATVHAEIGLVIARRLQAGGVVERYQDPIDRCAKMLPMAALGEAKAAAMPCSLHAFSAVSLPEAVESVASENIPSRARTGRNRARRSLRHAPRVKACLLGVNCVQTAGIA
jgi:hypothetical protein